MQTRDIVFFLISWTQFVYTGKEHVMH